MHVLVVVDMQNDFIDGALGTPEAAAIVPKVVERIRNFDGLVLATRDTHTADYLSTQEGRHLPVKHCVMCTSGWAIHRRSRRCSRTPVDKPSFGSVELGENLRSLHEEGGRIRHARRPVHRHLRDFERAAF